jgi:hypothetical protein
MFLHITFSDGSNHWVKFRLKDGESVRKELKKWQNNYNICGYWVTAGFMATATEKHPTPELFEEKTP